MKNDGLKHVILERSDSGAKNLKCGAREASLRISLRIETFGNVKINFDIPQFKATAFLLTHAIFMSLIKPILFQHNNTRPERDGVQNGL